MARGPKSLPFARRMPSPVPVVVVSRYVDVDLYLDALEKGAWDYIVPPFRAADLAYVVNGAIWALPNTCPPARWMKRMLRITFVEESEPAMLKVEGKLRGPWVDELKRSWSDFSRRHPVRSIVVDLTDVTSIDSEGNKLLRKMSSEGAKFQCGHLMKFILDQLERGQDGSNKTRKGG